MNYFGSNQFSIGSEEEEDDQMTNDFNKRMVNRQNSGESLDGG